MKARSSFQTPCVPFSGFPRGDLVSAIFEAGRIVIAVPERIRFEGKIIADPETGLPVLDFGPVAPILTSEIVAEILADFP